MPSVAEYEAMKVDELRRRARDRHIPRTSKMRKRELIEALQGGQERRGDGGGRREGDQPPKGHVIRSVDEHESYPGETLVTRNHDVIRAWAEARGATPATVPGTEHGDHVGVLTFDFPGYGGENLRHVSWEEWFRTFDERGLWFIYQEHTSDGSDSNFFRLENPEREDA